MAFPKNLNPPQHRRYNEEKALASIRLRYQRLRRYIPSQTKILQADKDFVAFAQGLYRKGYPDWAIMMTVINCMTQWMGIGPKNPQTVADFQMSISKVGEGLQDTTFPPWRFLQGDFLMHLRNHGIIVLDTYGFEMRRCDFDPDVVLTFLKQRMNHFGLDIPHQPLFGEPPGDWPDC